MCFSASASAVAALVTGGAGMAALSRCTRPEEIPLAGMPLLFSLQQTIESGLWLYLPGGTGQPRALLLANLFAAVALIVWPLLVPIAIGLVEPVRRRLLYLLLTLPGLGAALFAAMALAHQPVAVTLARGSICYIVPWPYPLAASVAYMAATCLPPLLSSHSLLRLFGAVVAAGLVVSYTAYIDAFLSVWCFFAALASLMLAGFFHVRVTALQQE